MNTTKDYGVAPLSVSLYVHYPWCIRKCPYCDFSSFAKGRDALRDQKYFAALKKDYVQNREKLYGRKIVSVYFGGGTPSLCPPEYMADFLAFIRPDLATDCEISMEANPGTVSRDGLSEYLGAGLNRLRIGVQSFNDRSLKAIGRIHDGKAACAAVKAAFEAGFENVNVDLMHALPDQGIAEAVCDLQTACALGATHISWYELTIEEGTAFGRRPPHRPDEEILSDEEERGFGYLTSQGYERYEVSAFALKGLKCVHNRNYWLFNDYLGIGAGGCGKIFHEGKTIRRSCPETPDEYMNGNYGSWYEVLPSELPFEFVLNRLRLFEKIKIDEFFLTTGLPFEHIKGRLEEAAAEGLLRFSEQSYELTHLGKRMLNDILEKFL